MRAWSCLGILVVGCLCLGSVWADDDAEKDRIRERIAEWEKAALNREIAAMTQLNQAEELLETGREHRAEEYLLDTEMKANFKKAGDSEKQAGDRAGAACANFDLAAKNWVTVAEQCAKVEDADSEKSAKAMAEAATEHAGRACAVAADAYELAADAYGADYADEPQKGAAASEKAATWREKMAGRK